MNQKKKLNLCIPRICVPLPTLPRSPIYQPEIPALDSVNTNVIPTLVLIQLTIH